MTVYRTCTNCNAAKSPCVIRERVRVAIKGSGITSVKFRCDERRSIFQPGQRVSVAWPVYSDREDSTLESWPATIIDEVGSRFLISVDDVPSDFDTPARDFIQNEHLFAKVSSAKLAALDEPLREICAYCQRAPAIGDVCKEGGWLPDLPPRCVLARIDQPSPMMAQAGRVAHD